SICLQSVYGRVRTNLGIGIGVRNGKLVQENETPFQHYAPTYEPKTKTIVRCRADALTSPLFSSVVVGDIERADISVRNLTRHLCYEVLVSFIAASGEASQHYLTFPNNSE